jgi:hypothetical protein
MAGMAHRGVNYWLIDIPTGRGITIPVLICILPLTHVGDDVLEGEHGGAINPRYVRLWRLMTALQSSRYVGYGHLHVFAIDGRDKNVWPAVIVP